MRERERERPSAHSASFGIHQYAPKQGESLEAPPAFVPARGQALPERESTAWVKEESRRGLRTN